MKTSFRARIGKIRLPSSLASSFSSLGKVTSGQSLPFLTTTNRASSFNTWTGFPHSQSLDLTISRDTLKFVRNPEWKQSNLYSGYWSCWSLSSMGVWLIFFWSPINVIRRRFLYRMMKCVNIRTSRGDYRKNHLKFPVTMLWIASFTLKEKCLGRQRWPSLLIISTLKIIISFVHVQCSVFNSTMYIVQIKTLYATCTLFIHIMPTW